MKYFLIKKWAVRNQVVLEVPYLIKAENIGDALHKFVVHTGGFVEDIYSCEELNIGMFIE